MLAEIEGKKMTEQEKVQLRQKWKKWIDKIDHDLGDLLISQDIIKEVSQIAASNKRIQSSPFFFNWIQGNYVDSVVIGIGRLNDDDDRVISLHNLIKEIIENPEVITRDYFVSRYPKWMQDKRLADKHFNTFADGTEQFVNEKKLQADLLFLKDKIRLIKGFRDQWVAHLDKNRPLQQLATHNDVEKSLSTLDEIFRKYYMLIDGGGMATAKPELVFDEFDWKESLRYPWIQMTEEEIQWRMKEESDKD
jgi:hypothetical protein